MNKLYETFLSEFIRKNKNILKVKHNLNLIDTKDQKVIGKLFEEFKMKCDLLLTYNENGSNHYLLIDFKYKILDPDKKKYGVSISDLYQMFAYSESQEQKYRTIILIYPEPEFQKFIVKNSFEHEWKEWPKNKNFNKKNKFARHFRY